MRSKGESESVMNVVEKGKEILCLLENHGHQAYLVGGCVRDSLLQRSIHDVDICTSALPEEVLSLFDYTIPTGLKHGTVSVMWKGERFEVTTFRTEGQYQNSRHPEHVSFVRSLKKDLERRDFTMNAIAMDKHGEIVDYFQGIEDLKQKRIRTVGTSKDRFAEDALRMLRAIRFSAQLGFSIEKEILQSIRSTASDLNLISIERKTSEFEKMMAAGEVSHGISYLLQGDIVHQAYPFTLLAEAFAKVVRLPLKELLLLERWLLLITSGPYTQATVYQFLHRLTLRKRFVKELKKLYKIQTQSEDRIKASEFQPLELFHMGWQETKAVLKVNQLRTSGQIIEVELEKIDQIFQSFPIQDIRELQVSGHELMIALNKTPGPWIQSALHLLVSTVVTGQVENQKENLIAYMLEREENEFR
jgi:tRNA nucleotidyltransferase (CCA-adding enzyme)